MKKISVALVIVCLMGVGLTAGTAAAAEPTLSISAPSETPYPENMVVTVSGSTESRGHVYVYFHAYEKGSCGATANEERQFGSAMTDAGGSEGTTVEPGTFSFERASRANGKSETDRYLFCGYFVADGWTTGSPYTEPPDAHATAGPVTWFTAPTPHVREASLKFVKVNGKLIIKGRITVPDGTAECIMKEAFELQKRLEPSGKWGSEGLRMTNEYGKFRVSGRSLSKGRYRARFVERSYYDAEGNEQLCGAAFSPIFRYRGLNNL